MKTQEQILARIETLENDDFFGYQRGDLMDFLDFKNAKQFLKKGAGQKKWEKCQEKNTKKGIEKIIKNYIEFAWGKANGCRGLSAGRSIEHFSTWLWLYDEKLYQKIEDIEYEHYGKEKLVAICEHFGWDYKKWDDGVRTNTG